jgi:hypothetical protein
MSCVYNSVSTPIQQLFDNLLDINSQICDAEHKINYYLHRQQIIDICNEKEWIKFDKLLYKEYDKLKELFDKQKKIIIILKSHGYCFYWNKLIQLHSSSI